MSLPFLQFPSEIRQMVYEELLLNERNGGPELVALLKDRPTKKCLHRIWNGIKTDVTSPLITVHPEILATCRLCATEGVKVLCHQNRFHIVDLNLFRIRTKMEDGLDGLHFHNFDRRSANSEQGLYARYLRVWGRFRHLSIDLDRRDFVDEQVDNILALTSEVFPNIQSLQLATIPSLSNHNNRCVLLSVALNLCKQLEFQTAVYRSENYVGMRTKSIYNDLSMTLFRTEKVQKVKNPVGPKKLLNPYSFIMLNSAYLSCGAEGTDFSQAFFIDAKAMADLVGRLTRTDFFPYKPDEILSAAASADERTVLKILDEAKARTEKRLRERLA